jgi:hypothetical protein
MGEVGRRPGGGENGRNKPATFINERRPIARRFERREANNAAASILRLHGLFLRFFRWLLVDLLTGLGLGFGR